MNAIEYHALNVAERARPTNFNRLVGRTAEK
nr:MAG TPA: hypothetical protein [Caudoviricetes sp.]